MNFQSNKELINYFDQQDLLNEDLLETKAGVFLKSPLSSLNNLLVQIVNKFKLIDHNIFIDAGSGDGRVVYLAQSLGFEKSYGFEIESELITRSNKNLLVFKKYFKQMNCLFKECDFTSLINWEKLKTENKTKNLVVFNYENNYLALYQTLKKFKKLHQDVKIDLIIASVSQNQTDQKIFLSEEVVEILQIEFSPIWSSKYDEITKKILGIKESKFLTLKYYQVK